MKVVITCGPGYEPIDEVRRLTNFSTGALGGHLARHFAAKGFEVICFRAAMAVFRAEAEGVRVIEFGTGQDLAQKLEALPDRAGVGAVLHTAALSDFVPGRILDETGAEMKDAKVSSRVGVLRMELVPAPKIIARLRAWFPQAFIAGWKYEVDGPSGGAVERARRQMEMYGTDAGVANGRAYGSGYGICLRGGDFVHVPDPLALAEELGKRLERA
jgi:phosphopantothenoylcysteine synthetase/decarboxylase